MADSSMSKLKLGPQESEENGKCNDLCLVQVEVIGLMRLLLLLIISEKLIVAVF